jgi:hypothetical protein
MCNSDQKFERDSEGKLVAYAWPGGYPMFYLVKSGDVLCPVCANKNDEEYPEDPVIAGDANWEDPELHCGNCNKRIESAYAEDEVEDRAKRIPKCRQCQMLNINGHNCHETGCPNERKTWNPEDQDWVTDTEDMDEFEFFEEFGDEDEELDPWEDDD